MIDLSVVIPTYNRRDSLLRTLDGLARQSYPMDAYEVVVVSDGSSDGTHEMLAEYAEKSPYKLRWFAQENGGPSRARNRGFAEAENEVVVLIDDDVEPVPQFLARHAGHHEDDEKVVVVGPMSPDPQMAANEPAWIAWEHAKLQRVYDFFRPGGEFVAEGPRSVHFYSGNASVRRRWLRAVNGFDPAFTRQEDVEMAARMERACGLHFVFDFAADGLHRPVRTLESWLKIPTAYGALDAERILAGTLTLSETQGHESRRHPASRLLVGLCRAVPALTPLTDSSLLGAMRLAERLGRRKAALAALSAVYNLRYHSALKSRLGAANVKKSVEPSAYPSAEPRQ